MKKVDGVSARKQESYIFPGSRSQGEKNTFLISNLLMFRLKPNGGLGLVVWSCGQGLVLGLLFEKT